MEIWYNAELYMFIYFWCFFIMYFFHWNCSLTKKISFAIIDVTEYQVEWFLFIYWQTFPSTYLEKVSLVYNGIDHNRFWTFRSRFLEQKGYNRLDFETIFRLYKRFSTIYDTCIQYADLETYRCRFEGRGKF